MICLTQTRAIFSTACTCITQPPVSPTVAHLEIHKSQKAIGAMLLREQRLSKLRAKKQSARHGAPKHKPHPDYACSPALMLWRRGAEV
jgi:hypothetical protein